MARSQHLRALYAVVVGLLTLRGLAALVDDGWPAALVVALALVVYLGVFWLVDR